MDQLTREGIDALRLGERETGRGLLERAVAANPDNAVAHLWLASIGRDKEQPRRQAKRPAAPEPHQTFTSRDLHQLDGVPRQPYRRTFELLDRNTLHRQQSGQASAPPVASQANTAKQAANPAVETSPEPAHASTGADAANSADQSGAITAAAPALAATGDAGATAPSAPDGQLAPDASITTAPPSGADEKPSQTAGGSAGAAGGPLADDLITIDPAAQPSDEAAAPGAGPATAAPNPSGTGSSEAQPQAAGAGGLDLQLGSAGPIASSAQQPQARRRSWMLRTLLLAGAVCAAILAVALSRDLREAQNVAESAKVTPLGTSTASGKGPAVPVTIYSSWGTFMVPGTAYIDVTEQIRAAKVRSVVPVWPEPFKTSGASACAVPHGTAVQLLDTATNAEGARAFKVRLRDCDGWVEDGLLKDAAVAPVDPADVQVPSVK